MLNGFVNYTVTRDLAENIKQSLAELAKKTVCIGVPDSTQHEDDKITNAELAYIHTNGVRSTDMRAEMQHNMDDGKTYSEAHEMYVHEHGSPMYAIPPRPILIPAIDNSKDEMAELMKDAIRDSLDGKDTTNSLDAVGMQGQNICRDWFTNPSNNWPANAKSTIDLKGSSNPLIDSGELRKSITYVVKDGE